MVKLDRTSAKFGRSRPEVRKMYGNAIRSVPDTKFGNNMPRQGSLRDCDWQTKDAHVWSVGRSNVGPSIGARGSDLDEGSELGARTGLISRSQPDPEEL